MKIQFLNPLYSHFALKWYTGGLITLTSFYWYSCTEEQNDFMASGIFEATEITVSALSTGSLTQWDVKEGMALDSGRLIGRVDCADLQLQKNQVLAGMEAIQQKTISPEPEIKILQEQILLQEKQIGVLQIQQEIVVRERDRISRLVKEEAAPSRSLDDLQGQVDVLSRQLDAANHQLKILNQQIQSHRDNARQKNRAVLSELKPMQANKDRLDNQLNYCEIKNPEKGTVLANYVEKHEYVHISKPLYKIANLEHMVLRVYISSDQLTGLEIGSQLNIRVDNPEGGYKLWNGNIGWISDKAEFTPKTIQTKDERAHLVYAMKIFVVNDGSLRIGMYGELIR